MNQEEILVESTLDGTLQPSLFYRAKESGRPLLVGLHTWSYDRFNQIKKMLPYAERYDINLLLPEFRGSNLDTNPNCKLACGSEYAKRDIKDAIDYIVKTEKVDSDNIFLLGASGGGHMSLLMAGYCPEYFKSIGAFVPITDLKKWTEQNANYKKHVLACCDSDEEMAKRSPVTYMDTIARANLKIFHGKYDHVVPVIQSIELYDKLFRKYPDSRVFLDIFDGGHQMNMDVAMYWLLSNYKESAKLGVTG